MISFGNLIPAVEIDRGIGPDIDQPPAAVMAALNPAVAMFDDREHQEENREAGAGGQQPAGADGLACESPGPVAAQDREERDQSDQPPVRQHRPEARDDGENRQRHQRQAKPEPLGGRQPRPAAALSHQDHDERYPDPRKQVAGLRQKETGEVIGPRYPAPDGARPLKQEGRPAVATRSRR